MLRYKLFKPTIQKSSSKKIYGYDIETYDRNRKFYCASIYGDTYQNTFFSKDEVCRELSQKRYRNSYIVATNLQFDFFGTFFGTGLLKHFKIFFRDSSLLWATIYYNTKDKKFSARPLTSSSYPITFIDTMNFAHLSVDNLGKLIGIGKLKKPSFLGDKPRTKQQREQMLIYNMRDSEISQKALKFLFRSFIKLGATPKKTLASTSMSIFRNKYLKDTYIVHFPSDLKEQFKGYYGGRVEAFSRGIIDNYNVYDFNSLYPSCMLGEFPDPNTMKKSSEDTIRYIDSYDGISDVVVYCPKMDYPLLPCRHDNKLLFPTGTFRGMYSNVELRKAIQIGYVIKKVNKSIYFTENFYPFTRFVLDLYEQRIEYKKKKNKMEFVTKIVLNSLYGKFAQKFEDCDEWLHVNNVTLEQLLQFEDFEIVGDYIRVKKRKTQRPPVYCFPIWSLYVTAYGRILLHDYLIRSQAIYCDTDSLITKKTFESSTALGKLKYEGRIQKGIIVKPKFYAYKTKDKDEVKIKGLYQHMTYKDFSQFLKDPTYNYKKFLKFKESLRRGYLPNEIIDMFKSLDLEDNKRSWSESFSMTDIQVSEPKEVDWYDKQQERKQQVIIRAR